MKNQNTKLVTVHHTTGQKVFGVLAFAALFVCGVMVGVAINGANKSNREVKEIGMTESQCESLAGTILQTSNGLGCMGDACVTKLRELNDVYTKNCAGRTFEVEAPKTVSLSEDATEAKETCEVIEDMLTGWLVSETSLDEVSHRANIETYKRLVENGCPENAEKYQALIQREQEILAALSNQVMAENIQTCAEIETLLLQQLPFASDRSDDRIDRAKVYANLSERGCAENSQRYVELAAKELEIARALRDDKFSEPETVEVVETYKRLEMKQAANEVLDKVQKLTDPAIDFILQIQKIIEE